MGLVSIVLEDNYWFKKTTSVFVNGNMTWSKGETPFFYTGTDLYLPTFSVGIKEFFYFPATDIFTYLGIGLSFCIPYTHNYYAYSSPDIVRFSPGLVFKTGFLITSKSRILRKLPNVILDLFFDYYVQPTTQIMNASFQQSLIDIGGFRTGGGLGYLF